MSKLVRIVSFPRECFIHITSLQEHCVLCAQPFTGRAGSWPNNPLSTETNLTQVLSGQTVALIDLQIT